MLSRRSLICLPLAVVAPQPAVAPKLPDGVDTNFLTALFALLKERPNLTATQINDEIIRLAGRAACEHIEQQLKGAPS